MPNHITNILTIDAPVPRVKEIFKAIAPGPSEEEVRAAAAKKKAKASKKEADTIFKPAPAEELAKRRGNTYEIDFEKIVPGRPGDNEGWYEWSIANWGTKWNAYDMDKLDDHTILFRTAWSMPWPVIEALSKMFPDVGVQIKWADEDTGFNCGEAHIKDGKITYENVPAGGSKEAYEIAFDVQGGQEYYEYDEEKGTYVYKDMENSDESRLGICPAVHCLRERFDKLVETIDEPRKRHN